MLCIYIYICIHLYIYYIYIYTISMYIYIYIEMQIHACFGRPGLFTANCLHAARAARVLTCSKRRESTDMQQEQRELTCACIAARAERTVVQLLFLTSSKSRVKYYTWLVAIYLHLSCLQLFFILIIANPACLRQRA